MAAPKGNNYWTRRKKHGRNPIFKTPDDMWRQAQEYFDWVEANPLYETKAFAYKGIVTTATVPKMRAMTIQGLCLFLDISDETWYRHCDSEDFSGVTERIKKIIYTQKFEGASADLLNANIITRELGLAEKTENSTKLEVNSLSALLDELHDDSEDDDE